MAKRKPEDTEILYRIVHEWFEYKDGQLFWKISRGKASAGKRAGCICKPSKYRHIVIKGKIYKEHRLVYLIHYGYLPEFIDHVDGDPLNNSIENLRECTLAQNNWNVGISSDNSSGVKGVSWDKRKKKWRVRVQVRGVRKHCGCYDDLELAELVANEAREHYHKDFARHE